MRDGGVGARGERTSWRSSTSPTASAPRRASGARSRSWPTSTTSRGGSPSRSNTSRASAARRSTDPSIPVAAADLSSREIPTSYVPFRNAHLLAAATSWAEVIGAARVYIGAVAEDSSGYPDCRPEFYEAFQRAVDVGTKPSTRVEIRTPVIHLRKSEIVRRGLALGAPLRLTWSCYQAEERACGRCDSCALRLRAFAEAGAVDPIAYA